LAVRMVEKKVEMMVGSWAVTSVDWKVEMMAGR
jgi:hypothetical protein